jgi:hypothetical protein
MKTSERESIQIASQAKKSAASRERGENVFQTIALAQDTSEKDRSTSLQSESMKQQKNKQMKLNSKLNEKQPQ